MTKNIDRAVEFLMKSVVMMNERLALDTVRNLHEAGYLAHEEWRTAYGVWSVSPDGSEYYDWIRDESRDTATNIVRNMRKAGWEAEVIARHVSAPRFITRTGNHADGTPTRRASDDQND